MPLRLFLIHCSKKKLETSDHQCSEEVNLLNGFTLRMWNFVSSSWFERLRISDRKFVNHTTEMILWSMILKLAPWAVGNTRGQPKQLVSMDFCSASWERDWALIVGTFHFRLGAPWLKKPSRLLLHKLHALGFRSDNHRWKNQMPTPSVSCTLDFPCKLCLIAKTYHRYALKTTNQGVYHNKVWSCTEFARLLHKIRVFFLGQMNVLLWTLHNWFQLHFGRWALKEF